jgi:biopolymer transport protein ExbB
MQSAITPKVEFLDSTAPALQTAHDLSPWGMYLAADGVVKTVIILLVLASLMTWTVFLSKYIEFAHERRALKAAMASILQAGELRQVEGLGCQAVTDMAVHAEDEIAASSRIAPNMAADGMKQRVSLRLERVEAMATRQIGKSVGLLAIIGSTATFVGLFGTVWGVMNSFIGIAQSRTTNLAVVAPGIAEALLATAFGLMAAIPAVVIYNLFARIMSAYRGELGDASASVLCLAAREIDRAAAHRSA